MVIIDCKAFNEKTRGKWVPKDVPGTGSDFEDHLFGSGELTLTDKVNKYQGAKQNVHWDKSTKISKRKKNCCKFHEIKVILRLIYSVVEN